MKGYIPLKGRIRQEVVDRISSSNESEFQYDEEKLKYLECLARECKEKGTRLVFVVSPYYGGASYSLKSFEPLNGIAVRYDVPFLYYNYEDYNSDSESFKDSHHLNDMGARAFTRELVKQLAI